MDIANKKFLFLKKPIVAAVFIVLLAVLVKLPGGGDFMTVDEENWMIRSATFWHELFRQRDPGGTFLTTHPGATTMWLSGAGIFLQEARLGFDIDTSNLRYFRKAATLPMILATSVLSGIIFSLFFKLTSKREAWWAVLILILSPYLLGMSQITHLDVLLSLFMLASVLSLIIYTREGKQKYLFLAGLFGGLVLATKGFAAMPLVIFWIVLLAFWVFWFKRGRPRDFLRDTLFVLGTAVVIFYLVWPALWVKQGLGDYAQRDVTTIISDEHVELEQSSDSINPWSFYLRTVLSRLSLFTLVLSTGMGVLLIKRFWVGKEKGSSKGFYKSRAYIILTLFLFVAIQLLVVTLVARKADRYALPSLVALIFLAGWGWGIVMDLWGQRKTKKKLRIVVAISVVGLFVVQTLLWSPHCIAYTNGYFDIRPLSQQGWGEGLEEAAEWLNNHSLADRLMVASWYPSVMRTYFNGETMSVSSRNDERVGFVVLYRNMLGRAPDDVASNAWDEFRGEKPAKVIDIQGRPYVWIFETIGLNYYPGHGGEITQGVEVGQTVLAEKDNWSSIELGMATFSGRNNTKDVYLSIYEDMDSREEVRKISVNAAEIIDREWHRFSFEPIENSANKVFYVAVSSPESVPGDAVTVKYVDRDIKPGKMLIRRRELRPGERNSDFIKEGDIAYRLSE